ncbi:MAG: caspase family protein [Bacteroidota bacterium]
MKKTIIALLLLACACAPANALARKRALVVGLSNYAPVTGWLSLNSHNDVVAVKEALLLQGFAVADIVVLEDAAATREGIIAALNQLHTSSASGDLVYFHFSGHGQQMWDASGDEIDGYDESIVPYDAQSFYNSTGYKGEKHISDEELGSYFLKIRKKLGNKGQLIVLLDSCHSGTGLRGMGAARGTNNLMAPADWIKSHEKTAGLGDADMSEQEQKDILAPFVAFFASDAGELNYEIKSGDKQMGPLTAAFVKAFSKVNTGSTYSGLFDKIRNEMAVTSSRQHPRVEGYLDRLVLNGQFVTITPYYSVTESGGELVLNGGWLQNLNKGSKVGFFPAETRDYLKAKSLGTGFITSSEPARSIVTADKPASTLRGTWAYVLEQSPGDMYLNVRLDIRDTTLRRKLTDEIKKEKVFGLEEEADCFLYQNLRGDLIYLGDRQNAVIDSFQVKIQGIETRIIHSMELLARSTYLRKLDFSDDSKFSFTLEIVPVDTTKDGQVARILPPLRKDKNGNFVITEGAPFVIRVKNRGDSAGYFNVLDIDPLNRGNVIAPWFDSIEKADDFELNPEQELILPRDGSYYKATPPYGMETIKLIVTDQVVDLRKTFNSRGPDRGAVSPVERMIGSVFYPEDAATRGNNTMPPSSLGVFTLNVKVVPKKVVIKP